MSEILLLSCRAGQLDVVKWLVIHTPANVYHSGHLKLLTAVQNERKFCLTPLTTACHGNHLDIVKYLVETLHVDVNSPDKDSFTLLTMACIRGSLSVSTYFLQALNSLDVNIATRKFGATALHYAVWCSKAHNSQLNTACKDGDVNKVLKLIYVCDQEVNVQNNGGFTPLHIACYYGHCDVTYSLLLRSL